ncbi:hypothetical protein JX265_009533 [Neoarthrinium moseri]|uniref:Uncharacterized protein n=1 Tax=Neoarthrinium moseri TaxID=1658444 RepID=A0A9P9WG34_9PEZI|nr:uncharacterized protein JN550_010674 [Neoarthrinium moseri]KAI1844907.1 hypothetical protein JX266_008923 [Neoarthrinium moseri]KAI1861566.1 hypothetical protein JX265_009533 [Neoarthrinium moseri]KAI1861734.1 hypothetical protein JN550_010674 [Neoarthrinium moseri]
MASQLSQSGIDSHTIGLALLRLAPLSVSSASLMFSWAQDLFISGFVNPKLANHPDHLSGKLLPYYMPGVWITGTTAIFIAYPGTMLLALANSVGRGAVENQLARRLYLAGSVMSIAHFYYGLRSKSLMAAIGSPQDPGVKNENVVRTWLSMHFRRSLLVNLPAWLCLVSATAVVLINGLDSKH